MRCASSPVSGPGATAVRSACSSTWSSGSGSRTRELSTARSACPVTSSRPKLLSAPPEARPKISASRIVQPTRSSRSRPNSRGVPPAQPGGDGLDRRGLSGRERRQRRRAPRGAHRAPASGPGRGRAARAPCRGRPCCRPARRRAGSPARPPPACPSGRRRSRCASVSYIAVGSQTSSAAAADGEQPGRVRGLEQQAELRPGRCRARPRYGRGPARRARRRAAPWAGRSPTSRAAPRPGVRRRRPRRLPRGRCARRPTGVSDRVGRRRARRPVHATAAQRQPDLARQHDGARVQRDQHAPGQQPLDRRGRGAHVQDPVGPLQPAARRPPGEGGQQLAHRRLGVGQQRVEPLAVAEVVGDPAGVLDRVAGGAPARGRPATGPAGTARSRASPCSAGGPSPAGSPTISRTVRTRVSSSPP